MQNTFAIVTATVALAIAIHCLFSMVEVKEVATLRHSELKSFDEKATRDIVYLDQKSTMIAKNSINKDAFFHDRRLLRTVCRVVSELHGSNVVEKIASEVSDGEQDTDRKEKDTPKKATGRNAD